MVCDGISGLECSVLLASQQDVKLLFIFFYYCAFIFLWWFFNDKRLEKIKSSYYSMPLITAKWSGLMYFLFTPVHLLLFNSNVDYGVVLGWFALFYIPFTSVAVFMPFLWVMDSLFKKFGYSGIFDFIKKYRRDTI